MPSTTRTTSPRSAPRNTDTTAPSATTPSTPTSSKTTSSTTVSSKTASGKTASSKTPRRGASRPAESARPATAATVGIGKSKVNATTDTTERDAAATDIGKASTASTRKVSGGATASGVSTRAAGGGAPSRLPSGSLRGMVEDFLRDHPAEGFGPVAIAKQLGGKSSGAVSNALDKLVDAGIAARVQDRPRRYALAASDTLSDPAPAGAPAAPAAGNSSDSVAAAAHEEGRRTTDAPAEAATAEAAAKTTGRASGRTRAPGEAGGGRGRARGTGRAPFHNLRGGESATGIRFAQVRSAQVRFADYRAADRELA